MTDKQKAAKEKALHWAEIHIEMYEGTATAEKWKRKAEKIKKSLDKMNQM